MTKKKSLWLKIEELIDELIAEGEGIQDINARRCYKQALRNLNAARGTLRQAENYLTFKQENLMIYNPDTGKIVKATEEQMLKIASMKGTIEDDNTGFNNQDAGFGRTFSDDAKTGRTREQYIADLSRYAVFRKAFLDGLSPNLERRTVLPEQPRTEGSREVLGDERGRRNHRGSGPEQISLDFPE